VKWVLTLLIGTLATGVSAADSLPLRVRAAGTVAGGADARVRIAEPGGLAIDAFGTLYVTDAALHRLQRFDARGAWLGESGSLGSDPGQLRRPISATTLGSLGVAVLDRENRRIVSYDLLGQRLGVLVDLGADALTDVTGRIDGVSLAADRGGALYLADAERDRILVFDFSGRFLKSLGGYGSRPGAFRGLMAIATTPRGEVVACERAGRRVQRLDPGGRVAAGWPLEVRAGKAPLAVAVDDSGRVAVADGDRGRLWLFDRAGRLLAARTDLGEARALAFAPDGSLVVAEAAEARVRRFAIVAPGPPPTERR